MYRRAGRCADLDAVPDFHPAKAPDHAAISNDLARAPEPDYGGQIQDFSTAGHAAKAVPRVSYTDQETALSGDATAHLRTPCCDMTQLGYRPLHPDTMIRPRIAPQMIGLGLLIAIPAQDILARADLQDADGDGIFGRVQIVWSLDHNQPMLGRFGLKAGLPSLREQTACRCAPDCNTDVHDHPEISDLVLDLVTFYSANLGVPARRDVGDAEVLRGKAVFYATGCTACHTSKHVTHRLEGDTEQSFQLTWPYTDMFLHNMGAGLADNRPEVRATGREWRTPPLWGELWMICRLQVSGIR